VYTAWCVVRELNLLTETRHNSIPHDSHRASRSEISNICPSRDRVSVLDETHYETSHYACVVGGNCSSSDYINGVTGLRTRRNSPPIPRERRKCLRWKCLTVSRDTRKRCRKPIQFATFDGMRRRLIGHRGSSPLVAMVPEKMIGLIVLALLLSCQSINHGGCLEASDTRVNNISGEISQRRLKRSLTFPDPSTLLVRDWWDDIAYLVNSISY